MANYTKELEIAEILARQGLGELNKEERALLEKWAAESAENAGLYEKITANRAAAIAGHMTPDLDVERFRNATMRKLQRRKRRVMATRIASFAAVLAAGVFSLLFLKNNDAPDDMVVAERTQAILSLPDGSRVELASEDAQETAWEKYTGTYDAAGTGEGDEMPVINIRIDVPRGGEYKLRLSDGTMVWLNSESSLVYPKKFTGDKRSVRITGEAYFAVERDDLKPFFVAAGNAVIKVTGTSFNIAAYAGEGTVTTTLVSGSVKVATEAGSVHLSPGRQAVVTEGASEIAVSDVDTSLYSSWIDGTFKFDKMPLVDIAARLSRWYDVDFIFEGNSGMERFTGGTWKYVTLREFLTKIERVTDVSFRFDGDNVVVTPRR